MHPPILYGYQELTRLREWPSLTAPTTYLLPHYLELAINGINTVQIVLLVVTRPASYRLVSLSTLLFVIAHFGPMETLVDLRARLESDLKRVSLVIVRFGRDQSSYRRNRRRFYPEEEEQEQEEEEEEKACWICFEEDWEPLESNSFKVRCRLAQCGHQSKSTSRIVFHR